MKRDEDTDTHRRTAPWGHRERTAVHEPRGGPGRNQPSGHLDPELPASRTARTSAEVEAAQPGAAQGDRHRSPCQDAQGSRSTALQTVPQGCREQGDIRAEIWEPCFSFTEAALFVHWTVPE